MKNKEVQIAARISDTLAERIKKATDREHDIYAPNVTQLIIRGVELALAELGQHKRPGSLNK